MNEMIDISRFPTLTEAERIEAEGIARDNILARDPEPKRSAFNQHTISKYPQVFTGAVFLFVVLMFAAGFGPSAFRIYHIANSTFSAADGFSAGQARIVGFSFVLLAEVAVVLFSMAAGVLDVSRDMKRLLYVAAGTSALLAIIGNVQVAIDYNTANPFDWALSLVKTLAYEPFAGFEAILPPLFTLLGGVLLKELVLAEMERRHANEHAYQTSLAEWQSRTKDLESHPSWLRQKANALLEIYKRAHSRKRVVKDGVTDDEWRAIIWRELQHGDWIGDEVDVTSGVSRPLPPAARPGLGFAHLRESEE